MIRSHLSRALRRAILFAAVLALLPAAAHAQTGRVAGTVVDQAGAAVRGAQVVVVGTRMGSLTNDQGRFALQGVPAGTHQLQVSHVGFKGAPATEIVVRQGEETTVEIRLESAPVQLGGLVVSASRQTQRITDAPATITKIGPNVLENSVGNSFAASLKEVKGLDFIQTGVTSVAVNARGFNSSFNNRMLMMEDGRISVLPENGLPVGQFTATPKVDLAGIEVLVGPGSALYGADASSGVISLQTKDPRDYPGTTVEVSGGSRSYKNVQARHAGVLGSWGYKVSGEWQDANEWENFLDYAINLGKAGVKLQNERDMGENSVDWRSSVVRGSGALVHYRGENRFEVSAGGSQTDGVGQTNVGRNQLRDWRYNFQQVKYSTPHWFFNAYRAQSQSGESFALNRYADAYARFSTALSADSLRKLSDWPSDGRMYSAEAQYKNTLSFLNDAQIVLGAQYRQDLVSSDRQWLTDRLTGEDVSIRQVGVYGQTTVPVASWADLVFAGRVDNHENYATQFSPKAGVVVKPLDDQAFRVTYNRAFKSPTILQTNFYIPDWSPVVSIFGNTAGYSIRDADGQEVRKYDPLRAEENVTWEFGYKGVLGSRLFVDVTHYRSDYEGFLSPLSIVSDPFGIGLAGQEKGKKLFAYDDQGQLITNAAGISPLVLIYYNLGEAKLTGTDAGVNFLLTPKVSLKGTLSLVDLQSLDVEAGKEEAAALNAPELKWTAGADFNDLHNFSGGVTLRHVDEYYFKSGINAGVIPGFTTLDARIGLRLPRFNNVLLNVGVSNLFSCGGVFTYDPTDRLRKSPTDEKRECGFGVKHQEMINMPEIGTMLFVGMRYHMQ